MELTLKSPKIWLSTTPIDFRKGINGLCAEIVEAMGLKPSDGIFIFYNRRRDKVKLLAWHGNGFVLCYKRLEQRRFYIADKDGELLTLDERQLTWLLAGLDWHTMSHWKKLDYDNFY